MSADPHVCSTDVTPIRAPRCLGSAAIVIIVSAEALKQKVVNHGLVLKGDVADRRRQGEDHMVIYRVGSSSASRSASHALAAAPWHFEQCRLRQLL